MAALTVRTDSAKGAVVVRLGGDVDAQSAPALAKALAAASAEPGTLLVVDLAGVNYVGSAGWGTFLGSVRAADAQGKQLVLAGLSRELRKVFEMLHFQTVLRTAPDVETAVRLVGG